MPFYNEEASAERVIRDICLFFRSKGIVFEVVCVQNGSTDTTAERLLAAAATFSEVRIVTVPVNRGYGYGIRQGLSAARCAIVGYVDGDGQVLPEDIYRVLAPMETARASMATRIERGDGEQRRVVSFFFNALFRLLTRTRVRDVNAKPKFFLREDVERLALISDGWFIDGEIILKAGVLGIVWAQVPLRFQKRAGGRSHVRARTIIEFLRQLFSWRFGRRLAVWKRTLSQ